MAIVTFEFVPGLGGGKIAIYSPEQQGPLQSLLRAMIAAMAESEAEVPPAPFESDALQALVVIEGVEHDGVQMEIEEMSDFSPERMFA